jgi:hypothetical protein
MPVKHVQPANTQQLGHQRVCLALPAHIRPQQARPLALCALRGHGLLLLGRNRNRLVCHVSPVRGQVSSEPLL